MFVTKYEQRFVLLGTFVVDMHLSDNTLSKMLEDCLYPRTRDRVFVQRLRRFRDTVEVALIIVRNQIKAQRSHKTHS